MTPLIPGLAGALLVGGVLLTIAGARRRPIVDSRPGHAPGRLTRWWVHTSPRVKVALLASIGVGLALAVTTGWVLAAIVLPLAVLGLPYLLMTSDHRTQIARLEAMAEWTRNLSGVLTAGVGLEQAIVVSLRSCPEAIRAEVARLVARLDARWPTVEALRGFADDLADPTGDAMAMMLMLGARSRGAGLATILQGVADSTAADVAARRQIEADRAKPRATARWVTIISIGVLAVFSLSGSFLAPYGTPLGQLVLGVLLAVYALVLVQMRRMAQGRPYPRLLNATDGEGV